MFDAAMRYPRAIVIAVTVLVLGGTPGAAEEADEHGQTSLSETTAVELEGWRAPEDVRELPNPVEKNRVSQTRGVRTYQLTCIQCHGRTGVGDGRLAKTLETPPADLTARVPYQSDGELFWKIGNGREPMPGFAADLDEPQLWDLVNYLRKLAPHPDVAARAEAERLAKETQKAEAAAKRAAEPVVEPPRQLPTSTGGW